MKKRFLEAQTQISELQGRQRDRKGSHQRVYQERDELLSHLHKSYLAFKEKYGENEQLKKVIEELKQSLQLFQETSAQVCICPFQFEVCCYTYCFTLNLCPIKMTRNFKGLKYAILFDLNYI